MRSYAGDVIVIGAGLAGICASLELLDAGQRVVMLDRDRHENFGGLAKESFGGIFVVGSNEQRRAGVHDTPAQAYADWASFAEFTADDIWPRRWAEAYVERCHEDVYQWVKGRGVSFFPVPHWIERGGATQGNSVPRFHMVWGTGFELVRRLLLRLESHPRRDRLKIAFGHRVEQLVSSAGSISGCAGVLEEDGSPFEASAGCVLVAAGGINGSIERVRRHWHADWGTPPETILNGSHRFADGTLHDAAQAVGARLTNLDRMWNYASGVHHWQPRKPDHGLSVVPPRSALWLDWRGERIGPEPMMSGFDTRELVTRVCAQERQYSWQLMNRRIAMKELAISGSEFNPSMRRRKILATLRDLLLGNRWLYRQLTENCADVVVAPNLRELVAAMNRVNGDEAVEFERVAAAVSRYDAAVARGAPYDDPQLERIAAMKAWRGDRVRTAKSQRIVDDGALPLVAIREFVISRKSLGGIQTDLSCRVLDAGGEPIPGLFAAGEAAGFGGGGMHGLRGLEGGFLGGCILGGRIAGRAIGGTTSGNQP